MFQTIRRQLAIWYTTVTAIVLLLFATGVYVYVRSTLIERVDDTLNHVVEVVQRSLVIEPQNPQTEEEGLRVNVEASFRDNAATSEDDRIDIEWFSPTGELLWSTFFEPLTVPLHISKGETVRVESANPTTHSPPLVLRQMTEQINLEQWILGYLRVSHPWFEVTKPSREFVMDLMLGTGLMVGAVGTIGWFLSGLAMAPVRESYQRLKQFTADASHELRSPIAVMQTNVQVALADPDPDPQMQRQQLQVIERLTRRLGRLVDDLLFLARQDSGMVQVQFQDVELEPLLWEVVEEQQLLADEKQIQITFPSIKATSDIDPVVRGDRDQLTRLFTNLIGNAVQYTPPNGKVMMSWQAMKRNHNTAIQVTVQDTGIGIPAAALAKIFERFYRVDPARSQASNNGSGLGLAIAQAIVLNHHGQIQIESTEHEGTTVRVLLPQRSLDERVSR